MVKVAYQCSESVCLCEWPADKMTNGDVNPEEKKQEAGCEKLHEDTLAGENHR